MKINYHDFDELHNRNEDSVWKAIEEYLDTDQKVCRCRDCLLDAAAIALNSLPARYHVYAFHSNEPVETEPGAEVAEAVAQAFEQVTKRPHHL